MSIQIRKYTSMITVFKNFGKQWQDQPKPAWDRTRGRDKHSRCEDLFSKIIAVNAPTLEKGIDIQTQVAFRSSNRHDQRRGPPWHTVKMSKTRSKEIWWKAVERKMPTHPQGRNIRIMSGLLSPTLEPEMHRINISSPESKQLPT